MNPLMQRYDTILFKKCVSSAMISAYNVRLCEKIKSMKDLSEVLYMQFADRSTYHRSQSLRTCSMASPASRYCGEANFISLLPRFPPSEGQFPRGGVSYVSSAYKLLR